MKTNYLFPSRYKKTGWLIFIPSAIIGFLSLLFNWEPGFLDVRVPAVFIDELFGDTRLIGMVETNFLNEITGVLIIIGLLFIAFSKERSEDEYISKIRLESLVWAVYVNYGILIVSFLFIFDFAFLWVMIFNMFTLLLFFIIRFNLQLSKLKKMVDNEE